MRPRRTRPRRRVSARMDRKPGAHARKWSGIVALAALTVALIVACRAPVGAPASSPASSDEPSASPAPTATLTEAPSASPAAGTRPAWVADLEGQLECDGPMNRMGQEVPAEVGPFEPAPTPELALEGLLRAATYAWLTGGGFEPPHVEDHWAQHRYLVDGSPKAIVISTNHFPEVPQEVGWEIVGLRACDPSEFDPADGLPDGTILWLGATGERMPASQIFSRAGPGHCGWEGVTFLHVEDELYLRDPQGILAGRTALPFRVVDALPGDAVDTGLHTATQRLFRVADPRVIFVRDRDGIIERWGRATDPIGCM
jgi:hypothetical protein